MARITGKYVTTPAAALQKENQSINSSELIRCELIKVHVVTRPKARFKAKAILEGRYEVDSGSNQVPPYLGQLLHLWYPG